MSETLNQILHVINTFDHTQDPEVKAALKQHILVELKKINGDK